MKTSSLRCCAAMLCALLLSSCDRDDNLTQHAEGYVRDYGTLAPVANTPLVLVGDIDGIFSGIDTCITDADGHYEFDYASIGAYNSITFEILSDKHYPLGADIFGGSLSTNIEYDIIARPKAWVKFHIKNVNPLNESDYIIYEYGTTPIPGMVVDTMISIEREGNKEMLIHYQVFRDAQLQSHVLDTLYLPAYDTTQYDIFY